MKAVKTQFGTCYLHVNKMVMYNTSGDFKTLNLLAKNIHQKLEEIRSEKVLGMMDAWLWRRSVGTSRQLSCAKALCFLKKRYC